MALEIFRLIGSVFVDTDKAEESLKKTDEKAEKTSKTFGEKLAGAAKTAGTVAVGLAGAVASAGTAIYAAATKSAAAADEIDKMSQKIGISRQSYQELDFILSQNGMDVNQLQGGMKKLVTTMQAVQDGNKKATAAFEKLGISVTDSDGALREQEAVFFEAISALQNMENETERAALANELFGKSASEMAPLLNAGAGSMEELRAKAHELGIVLGDDTIDAGVKFTDAVDQMKRGMEAIGVQVGAAVMPVLQTFIQWIIEHMPQIQDIVGRVFSVFEYVVNLAVEAVSWFGQILENFVGKAGEHGITFEGITAALKGAFEDAMVVIQTIWESVGRPVWDFIMQMVDLVKDLFMQNMPAIKEFVRSAFADIKIIWEQNLQPALKAIGDFIQNKLAPAFKLVFEKIIAPVVETVFNGIKNAWNQFLKPVLTGILDFITGVFSGNWEKAWNGIKSVFTGFINGILNGCETMVNGAIRAINGILSAIDDLKVVEAIKNLLGIDHIPTIPLVSLPRLAKGAVLERGQVGLLEGSGAEAVVPLENNRKWTQAVAQDMEMALGGASGAQVVALLTDLLEVMSEFAQGGIYLDGDALVGRLAKRMDNKLGQIQARKARA